MGRQKTRWLHLAGRPVAKMVNGWLVREDVTRNRETWSKFPQGWRLPALWVLVTADGYRYVEKSGRVWEITRPALLRFMELGDLERRTVIVPQEYWYVTEPEPPSYQAELAIA